MVCEYLRVPKEWEELVVELEYYLETGTFFENLKLLSGVDAIRVNSVNEIWAHLAGPSPRPVIANLLIVDSAVLGYEAEIAFQHAVVVVGIDAQHVTFFDPLSQSLKSTSYEQQCSLLDFEDAWQGGWVLAPRG